MPVCCRNATDTRIESREWVECNLTDGAEDCTTSDDSSDCYGGCDFSNETCSGCDVTPDWNATWCSAQDDREWCRYQHTTDNDACECCEAWNSLNEACNRKDVTANGYASCASWCHVQGNTACDRGLDSLVANETDRYHACLFFLCDHAEWKVCTAEACTQIVFAVTAQVPCWYICLQVGVCTVDASVAKF